MDERVAYFERTGKYMGQRLKERVNFDIEMIRNWVTVRNRKLFRFSTTENQ